MSEPNSPVLLASVSHLSVREIEDAGPTTLTIETWSDGTSRFQWKVNDTTLCTLELCRSVFYALLETLPLWFSDPGSPGVYDCCGSSLRLICVHLEDAPEIGLAAIDIDADRTLSMVMLERGMVITMLDNIGHQLLALSGMEGIRDCGGSGSEEDEDATGYDPDDPFAGMDISVRH